VPPGSGTRMGIDRDGDTLPNGVETNTGTFVNGDDTGTDPTLLDTDGDGFDDDVEVAAGTDPTNPLQFPGSVDPPGVPLSRTAAVLLAGALALVARVRLHRRRN